LRLDLIFRTTSAPATATTSTIPTMVFVSILTASFLEITCFAGQQKKQQIFSDLLLRVPL